ncbi:hypothetical protein ACFC4G_04380 [Streptomyces sp. NPDC056002]|uniref:hypothetical protein n=1 Tax=Streptomyces sp. NPDC056002 TaxID=3345675 RepID=UPI0035D8ED79
MTRGDGPWCRAVSERQSRSAAEYQVLLEAGAEARQTAGTGEELAGELEQGLTEAEPASGYLSMLRAGREQRESARSAATEMRSLLAIADQEELPARFAQTSVTCCAHRKTRTSVCPHEPT